jgi:hypothetical protein
MTESSTARLTLGTLVGLALAAAIAWRLGGASGTGILAGYLSGASLSALGSMWQNQLLRTNPAKVLAATVSVFLVKLALLSAAAVLFRYVEPLARQVNWRAFLVAFAAGVVVVTGAGSLDTLRILRERRSVA